MEYPMMEPPFPVQDFKEMTKKEAQQNFDWFISQIPNRINLLKTMVEYTKYKSSERLDLSEESLIDIWSWFIPHVKTVQRSSEEMKNLLKGVPDGLHSSIIENQSYTLSKETKILVVDVAIYFAEVFTHSCPTIKWGFITKPKSFLHVNKPVLLGFKYDELDPVQIVYNLTSRVSDGNKEIKQLQRLFHIWKEKIKE